MPEMPRRIHAFQIFYNDATKASLDPDFEPLDNSANERPDWYEYWPMRDYFFANALDEAAYYGLFSPLFFRKTQLRVKQVMAIAGLAGEALNITEMGLAIKTELEKAREQVQNIE